MRQMHTSNSLSLVAITSQDNVMKGKCLNSETSVLGWGSDVGPPWMEPNMGKQNEG